MARGRTADPIVESVVNDLRSRSSVGIKKYGTTLKQNNHDNFFQHLYEELLDAACYISKIKDISNNNFVDKMMRGLAQNDEVLFDPDALEELLDMYDEHNLQYERYCKDNTVCTYDNFQNALAFAGKVYQFMSDYREKKDAQKRLLDEIVEADQNSGLYDE